jgi:hypothetical protein
MIRDSRIMKSGFAACAVAQRRHYLFVAGASRPLSAFGRFTPEAIGFADC